VWDAGLRIGAGHGDVRWFRGHSIRWGHEFEYRTWKCVRGPSKQCGTWELGEGYEFGGMDTGTCTGHWGKIGGPRGMIIGGGYRI
jgi:hypothetical protein